MSKLQSVLAMLDMINTATTKQLKVVATGKGVNVSFKIRKKKASSPAVSWTAAGTPRIKGRPIGLMNGRVLRASDFKTVEQRRKLEKAVRLASKSKLLVQDDGGYVLNTGGLIAKASKDVE